MRCFPILLTHNSFVSPQYFLYIPLGLCEEGSKAAKMEGTWVDYKGDLPPTNLFTIYPIKHHTICWLPSHICWSPLSLTPRNHLNSHTVPALHTPVGAHPLSISSSPPNQGCRFGAMAPKTAPETLYLRQLLFLRRQTFQRLIGKGSSEA